MHVCVKLRQRENGKYRKLIEVPDTLYDTGSLDVSSSTPYVAGTLLEEGEWFSIMPQIEYSIDLIENEYETIDFDTLRRDEFEKIDFLFIADNERVIFQNVSRSKLIAQKSIISFGEEYRYTEQRRELTINPAPDAIFIRATHTLYFKRLESITSIFHGIDQLYREATNEETAEFLSMNFIKLINGYSATTVKTANRKRIALAKKTIESLDEDSRKNIFAYIHSYCPNLMQTEDSFDVGTENDLKLLLYGIEQRFYTTIVGNEKRIANSVVPFSTGQQ